MVKKIGQNWLKIFPFGCESPENGHFWGSLFSSPFLRSLQMGLWGVKMEFLGHFLKTSPPFFLRFAQLWDDSTIFLGETFDHW